MPVARRKSGAGPDAWLCHAGLGQYQLWCEPRFSAVLNRSASRDRNVIASPLPSRLNRPHPLAWLRMRAFASLGRSCRDHVRQSRRTTRPSPLTVRSSVVARVVLDAGVVCEACVTRCQGTATADRTTFSCFSQYHLLIRPEEPNHALKTDRTSSRAGRSPASTFTALTRFALQSTRSVSKATVRGSASFGIRRGRRTVTPQPGGIRWTSTQAWTWTMNWWY